MSFYLNPDFIFNSISAILLLIAAIFCIKNGINKNITPLIIMGCITGDFSIQAFGFCLNSILLNHTLARINTFLFFPPVLFIMLLINYSQKESLNSVFLIPIFIIGTLYSFLVFHPDSIVAEIQIFMGFEVMYSTKSFQIIINLLFATYGIFYMYINVSYI